MITPQEIKTKAAKKYKAYLQSVVKKEVFFPLIIKGNKKPSANIADFQKEITQLVNQSKETKGYGYTIEYKTVKTKTIGVQDLPINIHFETEKDYLKYLQKLQEIKSFKSNLQLILQAFENLYLWAYFHPQKIIQQQGKWKDILKVLNYFKQNPQPNLYIRELPIKVHTKFIENNKGIIKELLDLIIEAHIQANETTFEKRFNLKYSEPLVRFRILEPTISQKYFSGVNDISVPISQFQKLGLPIKKVLIVENKTSLYTTLTLPKMQHTIAIFGRGYGVANLKEVAWLKNTNILYWGDIDAQGFEILSQLRTYFPQTQSVLMDNNTFEQFFENDLGTPSIVLTQLNLTPAENTLYQKIKTNNWRLEQEKIPLAYVIKAFEMGT